MQSQKIFLCINHIVGTEVTIITNPVSIKGFQLDKLNFIVHLLSYPPCVRLPLWTDPGRHPYVYRTRRFVLSDWPRYFCVRVYYFGVTLSLTFSVGDLRHVCTNSFPLRPSDLDRPEDLSPMDLPMNCPCTLSSRQKPPRQTRHRTFPSSTLLLSLLFPSERHPDSDLSSPSTYSLSCPLDTSPS